VLSVYGFGSEHSVGSGFDTVKKRRCLGLIAVAIAVSLGVLASCSMSLVDSLVVLI
jgi:hypothetical protein